MTEARLPRVLLRLTDIALALFGVAIVLAIVVPFVAGGGANLELPISFVPEVGTYSISSDDWGAGSIESATGTVHFDDAGSAAFVASAIAATLVFVVPGLVVLILMRRIFASMAAGRPFAAENPRRIRWIGGMVIVFGLLARIADTGLQLFVSSNIESVGLDVYAGADAGLGVMVAGLVIIALAEVFRYGTELQADTDLTV